MLFKESSELLRLLAWSGEVPITCIQALDLVEHEILSTAWERAEALGTIVVVNHEARGAGGAPLTFRMSSPNSELVEVLAGAPGAFADSSSEASFEALSNDTDFTPFQQAGLYGYDTAIMADGAYYHSPIDDLAHLSATSLQQMGDTTLALTRELAGMDLAAIGRGGQEIVTALPWGLLWYQQSLEIPLAIAALVLTTVLVWLLRRRGALTLPRVAASAVASVVVLVAAAAASYAVWRLALLIDPAQVSAVVGESYRPVLYRFAMLLAGLAAVLSLFALVRRGLGAVGLAVGLLVVLALTGVLFAFTLPGVSGAVVQPTLVVAAGAVVAVLLPERRTATRAGVYLLALAVAAILLGPGVWIGFDIGLDAGPLSAVLLAMFVTLALPVIEAAWALPNGMVPRRSAAHCGCSCTGRGVDRGTFGRGSGGQPRGRDGCPPGGDLVLGRRRYEGGALGLGRSTGK